MINKIGENDFDVHIWVNKINILIVFTPENDVRNILKY